MVINADAEERHTAEVVEHDRVDDGDDSSDSDGSVQLNDVDHTENWIDDEFDAKEMEFADDHNDDEYEKQTETINLMAVC